jgi:hypothetical protein
VAIGVQSNISKAGKEINDVSIEPDPIGPIEPDPIGPFYGGAYSSSWRTGRVLNAFYNSQITLVAHQYILINGFAFVIGLAIRTVFLETWN